MNNFKKQQAIYLTFLLAIILGIYGCPGSYPKITLKVTDCEKEKITIEHKTTVTSQPGRKWTLKSIITIKCDGDVVPNAEIKVEFWWPNGTYKKTTGQTGKTMVIRKGDGDPPKGEKFKVTIRGNNGEKNVNLDVPGS